MSTLVTSTVRPAGNPTRHAGYPPPEPVGRGAAPCGRPGARGPVARLAPRYGIAPTWPRRQVREAFRDTAGMAHFAPPWRPCSRRGEGHSLVAVAGAHRHL